jgi:hypothetical protein
MFQGIAMLDLSKLHQTWRPGVVRQQRREAMGCQKLLGEEGTQNRGRDCPSLSVMNSRLRMQHGCMLLLHNGADTSNDG